MDKFLKKLTERRDASRIKIDFVKDWHDEELYLIRPDNSKVLIYFNDKTEAKQVDNLINVLITCIVDVDGKLVFNTEDRISYLKTLPITELYMLINNSMANLVKDVEVDKSIKKK